MNSTRRAIEQIRRLEPSGETELESVKEVNHIEQALNSQLKESEAVETGHGPQASLDERQEKGVDNVNKERSEDHDPEQRMHSTRTQTSCDANAR